MQSLLSRCGMQIYYCPCQVCTIINCYPLLSSAAGSALKFGHWKWKQKGRHLRSTVVFSPTLPKPDWALGRKIRTIEHLIHECALFLEASQCRLWASQTGLCLWDVLALHCSLTCVNWMKAMNRWPSLLERYLRCSGKKSQFMIHMQYLSSSATW